MTPTDPFRVYALPGPDGYPPEWHSLNGGPGVKDLVREEAGHRCVRCGHPYRKGEHGRGEWSPCDERCTHDGPIRALAAGGWVEYDSTDDAGPLMALTSVPVEARWRILTVHHLNGVKLDCRPYNLAALCQRCHLTIQRKVVMERVYPFEHSEWFQPYAAAWYAWTYEGRILTLDEARADLDRLLALERLA